SVADNVRAGAAKKRKPSLGLAKVAGARKAAMPRALAPQLATLAKDPPLGAGWVHEIKYDGYRMVCRIAGGDAQMYSRNGKDWTARFSTIARALGRLPVREAWIDGEAVVMQDDGRTSFQELQNALSTGDTTRMVFWAFDVVHVDGYDLADATLLARKRVLKALLEGQPSVLRYSEHLEGAADAVLAQACRLELEGIVSKRVDAPYQHRRGLAWLKVKCTLRQEMVIGGYTDPGGSRNGFGALLMGVHDAAGNLRYCGKVGTGFNEATLQALAPRLASKEQGSAPFVNPPRGYEAKGAHWVKPELVAEVAFTEWTRDGTARHPSFQGLREDKRPGDVVREMPADVADAETDVAAPSSQPSRKGMGRVAKRPAVGTTGAAGAKGAANHVAVAVSDDAPPGPVAGPRTRPNAKPRSQQEAATDAPRTPRSGKARAAAPRRSAVKIQAAAAATSARERSTPVRPDAAPGGKAIPSKRADTVAGIVISSPTKVLYPEAGHTKRDLAEYYEAVGAWMLPHIVDRPLTLVRCPGGWTKQCFFQKHVKPGMPDAVEGVTVDESDGDTATYMMANSTTALVALAQMGTIECHVWGSSRPRLDRPDRLVFDFDPDEDLGWKPIVEAVQLLRTLLDNLGLRGFVKTTGGKGLHVVVPIEPAHNWTVVKAFTKAVAELLVEAAPDRFTAKLSKSSRGGKIFVDYLRNGEGATAVAAYSARAKANAPVSLPIAWDELGDDVRFDHFNIRTVPLRLARLKRDPWAGFARAAKQSIGAELLARLGVRT
ncbi:MAG: non-homologous end-joining DNA ligase, partial [Casimicrobiaceae bacterium]